jgi:general stress protein 26
MAEKDEQLESIARIRELIKDIRVAMLTTIAQDGSLHSRPMMTQEAEFDGTLWSLTGQDTAKAGEVAELDQFGMVRHPHLSRGPQLLRRQKLLQ